MKYKYFLSVFVAVGILFSPFLARHTKALNDEIIFPNNDITISIEEKYTDHKNEVVSVFVDPKGNSINAVSIKIKYSKENLKPVIIDNTNSDFSLFFVEDINENDGIITITYIEPFPGVDYKALVADILFEKVGEKRGGISIDMDSEVLANDGFGTHLMWKSEKF